MQNYSSIVSDFVEEFDVFNLGALGSPREKCANYVPNVVVKTASNIMQRARWASSHSLLAVGWAPNPSWGSNLRTVREDMILSGCLRLIPLACSAEMIRTAPDDAMACHSFWLATRGTSREPRQYGNGMMVCSANLARRTLRRKRDLLLLLPRSPPP